MARRLISALLLSALLAALCAPSARAAHGTRPATRPHALHAVTIGMGYVPNVQFAPFYVAAQRGYYRRAGLDVTFSYASSPNLLQLVGAGRIDFAYADGTDAIAASARGIPITYVATLYQRLPVAIFALAAKGIHTVRDLRGKTIGVPGLYGSTYVGLLAALRTAGLRPGDVKIEPIGYAQAESVAAGKVDAAVGYSANEPLLLARRGYRVTTLEVGDVTGLVGPGLLAGRLLISRDPTLVRAFAQATLHGLADTIADPRAAFAAARRVQGLTTLRGRDIGDQYAVLLRAIGFWHGPATRAHGLGYADPAQWRDTARILATVGQLPGAPRVDATFTNAFSRGSAKS